MPSSRTILIHSVILALLGLGSARADPVADFYRGKQVTMLIPSGVGGGYDLYARFLARFIGKHIPGAPNVVVRNLPGAGGILEANDLYSVVAPDGLTFGEFQYTLTLNQLAHTPSIKFDMRKFHWIGSMSSTSTICALSGKAKDLRGADLFHKEIVIGAAGGSSAMIPVLLNSLAGTHFKVVTGYESTSNVQLAMENGEVEGQCGWSWDGARVNGREMFDHGTAKVALDIAIQPHPELKGMGAPFLMDLLPEGENKDVLKIILSTQAYSRPFAFPPGVPDDRVQALRDAFAATLQDAELRKEAEKTGMEIDDLSGDRIEGLINSVFDAPVSTQERAVEELRKAGFGS